MRLVVVGGGVAGPALALAARRQGLDTVVLERRAHADPDEGSWVTVAPNGLDALDALGLLEKARTIGAATRTNRMFGATGRLLGELSLGVPLVDGTVALTMKRSALAVLLQDAAREAGAEVRLGADVTAVNEQPGGVVAELATGERIAGDVLVGADGVHSRARSHHDQVVTGRARPRRPVSRGTHPLGTPLLSALVCWRLAATGSFSGVGGGR